MVGLGRSASVLLLALLLTLDGGTSRADGLIPGPGEPGFDPSLAELASRYDRQFHTFNASPFGVSLDAFIPDPDDRAAVEAFLAQSAITNFAQHTASMGRPRTADEVVSERDEHGDLGMFGGVAAVGDAYRYAVLRDRGGSAQEVADARADLLEAIASFHAYANITGTQGPIARGIRRVTEAGAAPEPRPATCPDAWTRRDTWRTDESGQHGGFYWVDNTSKDQLLGYVMALGAFWDVVADDPDIDAQVKTDLQGDATGLGRSLMTPVEVRPGTMVDLAIRDAGGCLVRFHDLNPREVVLDGSAPIVLPESSTAQNGFNALAALGIMRTLYHVSGAGDLRTYYYDVLVAQRGYPGLVTSGVARLRNMYINTCVGGSCAVTNFSNVNMAFVAVYGLLRYETDPVLQTTYRDILETELWDAMRPHDGIETQQAFFNLIFAGFRAGGTAAPEAASAAAQLLEFPAPPYWNVAVENCDAAELAQGTCIGIDGTTVIELDDVPLRGGGVAATLPVPKRIRPSSNFEWRSDPRDVNGGGSSLLNPGGDFRAAYWMGRFLVAGPAGTTNLSPIARMPDGTGGPHGVPAADAGVATADAAQDPPDATSGLDGGMVATGDGGFPPAPDAGVGSDGASPSDTGAAQDLDAASGPGDAPDAATSPDAGAGSDAGEPGPPVSTQPGDCSCSATPSGRAAPEPTALLLLALSLGLARRRR